MKSNKSLRITIITILILILVHNVFSVDDRLEIYSPNYFNEQNNIYDDIHYLENEQLSFKFCTDEKSTNISFDLTCFSQKINIPAIEYKDTAKGCYFSNYDIQNLTCPSFSLDISYTNDNKDKQITRTFIEQKQSMLINYILGQDYSSLNPIDLSYYLIVLTNLESQNSKKSQEVYDLLKNIRNNENKCWSSSSCKLIDTSIILRNLMVAQYNLNSRLLEDGKTYLERKLIKNDNNPIKILIKVEHNFTNNQEIDCELQIDNESVKTYTFDEDNLKLEKKASDKLIFSCNQSFDNITLSIYNLNDKISKTLDYENTQEINYDLDQFACLGESSSCDFTNSLNSLITYSSSIQDSSLIENYLNSYIITTNSQSYLDTGSNKYEDAGKYLYYKPNNELINYIKYKQNNDGSWGDNSKYDKIIQTSWAVLGIQKLESSSEYVVDGKKWIYYNEPVSGWGTIEKNTLAYLAIKEQIKPYLKINSKNTLKETSEFKILNPTIYELKDIKVKFSDNINQYLSYTQNLGNLEGENAIIFNVTVDNTFVGKLTGEMTITGVDGKNTELKLIKMPINIEGPMPFNIESKSYTISEDSNNIELEITNNIEAYMGNCTYINPFSNENTQIELNQLSNKIIVEDKTLQVGNYNLILKCNFENSQFEFPLNFDVVLANKNFEINESEVIITNTNDFKITLTNTNADKQVVYFDLEGDYKGTIEPTETEKVIAINDTREIYFTLTNPAYLQALGNSSKGNIIIKSESGYIKKIPITIEIPQNSQGFKLNWTYIIIGLITIFTIIIMVLRYQRSKENEKHDEENNNNDNEEIYI